MIMVKKDLSKDQLSQLKSIILEEDDDLFKWFLFDESLQELTKWKFTKKSLGKIVTVRVLEVVFCATIEWE